MPPSQYIYVITLNTPRRGNQYQYCIMWPDPAEIEPTILHTHTIRVCSHQHPLYNGILKALISKGRHHEPIDLYKISNSQIPMALLPRIFHSYITSTIFIRLDCMIDWFVVLNATFSNISAISVLVVEEARVPGENHRPWASNW